MNKIISILHVSLCIGLFIGVVGFAPANLLFSSSNSQLVKIKKCETEFVYSAFEKGNLVFKCQFLMFVGVYDIF
jgi:hypothetical protein